MSTVNYNDTTPSAPAGVVNIKWQSDASGNISAYDPVGAWTSYVPTITPQGGMTISSVTINYARYLRTGPQCFFQFHINGTLGGTLSNLIYLSLPPVAVVIPAGSAFAPVNTQQGTGPTAGVITITTTEMRVYNTGISNFVAGTVIILSAGSYSC